MKFWKTIIVGFCTKFGETMSEILNFVKIFSLKGIFDNCEKVLGNFGKNISENLKNNLEFSKGVKENLENL